MTQPKHDPREQAQRVSAKRALTKREREERRSRLVIMTTGAAIVIALVSVLSGVLYERVYVPNQMVATVGDQTLTRAGMVEEKRELIAVSMSQNLLLSTFGGTFAERFQQQNPYLEAELTNFTIKSEIDGDVVSNWVDRQLVEQSAKADYNIVADESQVTYAILRDYAGVLLPNTDVQPEPTVAPDAAESADAAVAPTDAPPTATPDAVTAESQLDQVISAMFTSYSNGLIGQGLTPQLTQADFLTALRNQYRRQVIVNAVKEQLVAADAFTASTTPTGYDTRQIFVRVETDESTSDAEREKLFDAKRGEAEALLKRVLNGEEFTAVAAAASQDTTSAARDGVMDSFDSTGKSVAGTQFELSYVEAALSLAPGEIYPEPVRTSFGWHIIKLDNQRVPSFDDQLESARSDAYDTWFAGLSLKQSVGYAVAPTATLVPEPTNAAPVLPTAPLGGYPTNTPEPVGVDPTTTPTPQP